MIQMSLDIANSPLWEWRVQNCLHLRTTDFDSKEALPYYVESIPTSSISGQDIRDQ